MLKAETISAVRLCLNDGVEAIFMQEGKEWNTLREYRCVAPAAYAGQKLITMPDRDSGPITDFFDSLLGRMDGRLIVMASPALGAAIHEANAASTSKAQA